MSGPNSLELLKRRDPILLDMHGGPGTSGSCVVSVFLKTEFLASVVLLVEPVSLSVPVVPRLFSAHPLTKLNRVMKLPQERRI